MSNFKNGVSKIKFTGLAVIFLFFSISVVIAPQFAVLWLSIAAILISIGIGIISNNQHISVIASHDKLSAEMDIVSKQIVKIEAMVHVALARTKEIEKISVNTSIDDDLEAVTQELGLLSGIVRELANVVATQEAGLHDLKGEQRNLMIVTQSIKSSVSDALKNTERTESKSNFMEVDRQETTKINKREVERDLDALPVSSSSFDENRILQAFDGEGLEAWLQPIVSLPQRKVRSYEVTARLRIEDKVLPQEDFISLLERHGRTTVLDRRMIAKARTIARHLQDRGSEAGISYGLSRFSLYEPDFLRSLSLFTDEDAKGAKRLTVALSQSSWRSLDREQKEALSKLRGKVGFVLDRATNLRFDGRTLAEHGVSELRIDCELLRGDGADAGSDIAVQDLVEVLGRAGIRLVATGVRKESDVPELIDLDVPLAQGEIFAPPRMVRAELLMPSAGEAEPPRPVAETIEAPVETQRRNFRDFLRRAS